MSNTELKPELWPDLEAVGVFFYGHDWKRALARRYDIGDRSVRRWAQAEAAPIWALRKVAEQLPTEIDALRELQGRIIAALARAEGGS